MPTETETKIPRQLEPGDKIQCPIDVGLLTITDFTCEIAEIHFQEPWSWRNAYYLEFTDTNGVYRSWKQNIDGGKAILKDA
jgi:hypothetical protein